MKVAVVGAGPHGQEIAYLLRQQAKEVIVVDDFLPGYEKAEDLDDLMYVAGAAWPSVRRQIAAKMEARHLTYNGGRVVFPGARVSSHAKLGRHVHVNYNAVVSHGCLVGSFTTICPNVTLSGDVTVEPGVFIGAGATVIHGGITIGHDAVIGAGAVVIRDVRPGETVVGIPAEPVRKRWGSP